MDVSGCCGVEVERGSDGAAFRAVWGSLWLEWMSVEWQSSDGVAMRGQERVSNVALVP